MFWGEHKYTIKTINALLKALLKGIIKGPKCSIKGPRKGHKVA